MRFCFKRMERRDASRFFGMERSSMPFLSIKKPPHGPGPHMLFPGDGVAYFFGFYSVPICLATSQASFNWGSLRSPSSNSLLASSSGISEITSGVMPMACTAFPEERKY